MAKDKQDKKGFQHESLEDGKSISAYLQAVREGFAQGTLRLSDQDGAIVLQPDGLVNFEVRATQRRGRAKLTMTFSWREADKAEKANGGTLKINRDDEDAPDAQS